MRADPMSDRPREAAAGRVYVYAAPEQSLLVNRCLERYAPGEVVLISDDSSSHAFAESVAANDATVAHVADRVQSADEGAEILLPVSLDSRPLDFYSHTYIPAIDALYPTVARLRQAGFRTFRIVNFAGEFELHVPHSVEAFHGRHKGQRCFVLGNGPSLNELDMGRLRDEITFGANRCYLGYESWGFECTYWAVSDRLQIERYGQEHVDALSRDTPKFVPFHYLPLLNPPHSCPVNMQYSRRPFFSTEPGALYIGHTVVIPMLQLAAIMGCNPIVLIGVDHRFNLPANTLAARAFQWRNRLVKPLRQTLLYDTVRYWRSRRAAARGSARTEIQPVWETKQATGPTHFDDRYTDQGGRQFLVPQLREATNDFREAQRYAERHGIEILNATPGSALDVFPSVEFESLF